MVSTIGNDDRFCHHEQQKVMVLMMAVVVMAAGVDRWCVVLVVLTTRERTRWKVSRAGDILVIIMLRESRLLDTRRISRSATVSDEAAEAWCPARRASQADNRPPRHATPRVVSWRQRQGEFRNRWKL